MIKNFQEENQLPQEYLLLLLKHKHLEQDIKRQKFIFRFYFKGKRNQKVRSFSKIKNIKDCDDFIAEIHNFYDQKDPNWKDDQCGCDVYKLTKQILIKNVQNLPNFKILENDESECSSSGSGSGNPLYGKRTDEEIFNILSHENLYFDRKFRRFMYKSENKNGKLIQRYFPLKKIKNFNTCNKIMKETHILWKNSISFSSNVCGCKKYEEIRDEIIQEELEEIQRNASLIISETDSDEDKTYGINC